MAKKKKPIKKKKAVTRKKPVRKTKKAVAKKKVKARAKKAPARRAAPAPLPWRQPLEGETPLGVVDDYYAHIGVIALTLQKPLAVGDKIHVRGHTTDLIELVESMQIGHQSVQQANAGDGVGIKVNDRCRKGDYIYQIKS